MSTPVCPSSEASVAAKTDGEAAADAGPAVARVKVRRTSGHNRRSGGETIFGEVIVPSVMLVAAPARTMDLIPHCNLISPGQPTRF
ncbi:hypothetical protein A7J05_36600 [Streptomyces alfalfae]|uniref:Uncharacterized protein n=1 Tax=Streptomyces alfalfae TaxID=1642299 RepID=A0ABN4VBV5_9ACTN|nr:hypothetical protein A7J05_00135 [Streptomyces alfalfae]APY90442.1 hypothetical protein A7J05_36600 [Streptomyces alfalfae]